uniref:Uncharacterized protein n=1 Tax=Arundo donax TaxID=35708 RepID=A0A0A8Z9B8_ARUDO
MAQIIFQLNTECKHFIDRTLQKLYIGCLFPILLRNESCSHYKYTVRYKQKP